MCAHEGMQVRGERIVGVWMQLTSKAARLTSMAARCVDDIEVCRNGSMCECLHKLSARLSSNAERQRAQHLRTQGKVALRRATGSRLVWSARRARARGARRGTTIANDRKEGDFVVHA